jgi:predicted cupin superfamily sugar epimerase
MIVLSLFVAANFAYSETPNNLGNQPVKQIMDKNSTQPSTITELHPVEALVENLGLEPHIEGGYYRRTYQSDHREKVTTHSGERFLLTSIYYLLTEDSRIGHWHNNKSDIIHYYHMGSPITYYLIHENGELETVTMGSNILAGEQLQLVVKGGTWKTSFLEHGNYALISEAVAPGFDFEDMTLGKKDNLLSKYPQHESIIKQFSKH